MTRKGRKGSCNDCPDFCKLKYKRIYCCETEKCSNFCGCDCAKVDLVVTTNPTNVTAIGQVVNFSYTVLNRGSTNLCGGIMICSKLNGKITLTDKAETLMSKVNGFVVLNAVYTTVAEDFDSDDEFIEDKARAFVQVSKCHGVHSLEIDTRIATSGADVFGTMVQTIDDAGLVTATITVGNDGASAIPAANVSLFLAYPAPIVASGITILGTPPPSGFVAGTSGLQITIPALAIGATNTYAFTYTPPAATAVPVVYTWSGKVTATTYDPYLANNRVFSQIVVVTTTP